MLNISKEVLRQGAVILKKIDFSQWIQHPNSFLTLYDRWLDIRGIYIPIEKGFLLFLEEFFELSFDIDTNKDLKDTVWYIRKYNTLDTLMGNLRFNFNNQTLMFLDSEISYNKIIMFYPNGYCPDIYKVCVMLNIDYSLFKTIFYGE